MMTKNLSDYSSDDLFRIRQDPATDRDMIYEAEQILFKRWSAGGDVHILLDLLRSGTIKDKLTISYVFLEVAPRVDSVRDAVTKLADDPLAECRRAFVRYCLCAGYHDEAIGAGLARCMLDFDLGVRIEAMNWAVAATDPEFEDLCQRVLTRPIPSRVKTWNEPLMKRSRKALDIARRLRDGQSVALIREEIPEEDSFLFDYFEVFENRTRRYRQR